MRKLLLPVLLFISVLASAQDSTNQQIDTTTVVRQQHLVANISMATKNYWRGNVYGDNLPMISGTFGYAFRGIEFGVIGTSPLNGSRTGYGIWAEAYVSVKLPEHFTVTLDDYYFFAPYDSMNNYFDWYEETTGHFLEYRVKYEVDRFSLMGSLVVYSNILAYNSPYFEGEYYILLKKLSVTMGVVCGESELNFFEKGGIAMVGVNGYRDLEFSENFSIPFKISVMTSPNYKHAYKSPYPGFTQNALNIIIGFSL